VRDTALNDAGPQLDVGSLVPVQKGRKSSSRRSLRRLPRRFEYLVSNCSISGSSGSTTMKSVRPKIYDRMISERRQIAERFLVGGNVRPPESAAIVCVT